MLRCKRCGLTGKHILTSADDVPWSRADLCPLCIDREEDEQVTRIAQAVAASPSQAIGFAVESDDLLKGKADRYLRKLRQRLPSLKVVSKEEGPVPQSVMVRVQLAR